MKLLWFILVLENMKLLGMQIFGGFCRHPENLRMFTFGNSCFRRGMCSTGMAVLDKMFIKALH